MNNLVSPLNQAYINQAALSQSNAAQTGMQMQPLDAQPQTSTNFMPHPLESQVIQASEKQPEPEKKSSFKKFAAFAVAAIAATMTAALLYAKRIKK